MIIRYTLTKISFRNRSCWLAKNSCLCRNKIKLKKLKENT